MPGAFGRGFVSGFSTGSMLTTPALISRGITLGPEQGEPGADFTNLGGRSKSHTTLKSRRRYNQQPGD
jgi:hypothetical protein